MSALEDLQAAVDRMVESVAPAVVGLGRGWGFGSGVVIGDGRVLTNAHNLRGDEVAVTFTDGRQAPGSVAGIDADGDLAVISTDTAGLGAVEWRPSDEAVRIGMPVFALANPGGRGLRVTFGLVSSTGRSFRGAGGRRVTGSIEHTAPLVRGSSGGPIVDSAGRLVGLNAVRLDGGLILAVAADSDLRDRADALARGESPARVRLGVAIAPPRVARRMQRAVGLPERDGLLVRAVEDGTPAARAGLERGDLIVGAGGKRVERVDDLYEALAALSREGRLELAVVRGIDERTVVVSLEEGEGPKEV